MYEVFAVNLTKHNEVYVFFNNTRVQGYGVRMFPSESLHIRAYVLRAVPVDFSSISQLRLSACN